MQSSIQSILFLTSNQNEVRFSFLSLVAAAAAKHYTLKLFSLIHHGLLQLFPFFYQPRSMPCPFLYSGVHLVGTQQQGVHFFPRKSTVCGIVHVYFSLQRIEQAHDSLLCSYCLCGGGFPLVHATVHASHLH
jgi:hypothetical protein